LVLRSVNLFLLPLVLADCGRHSKSSSCLIFWVPNEGETDLAVAKVHQRAWSKASNGAHKDRAMERDPGSRATRYILCAFPECGED
jgi:hypothetical protein